MRFARAFVLHSSLFALSHLFASVVCAFRSQLFALRWRLWPMRSSLAASRRGLFPEDPPPPLFSQVFILKGVKVVCFDTLLQVLILKVVRVPPFHNTLSRRCGPPHPRCFAKRGCKLLIPKGRGAKKRAKRLQEYGSKGVSGVGGDICRANMGNVSI